MSTQDVIDRATAAVAAATTVEASATALIAQIISTVRANVDNTDALNAAMDQFEANTKALSAAVVANTPAAPTATPPASTPPASTPPASTPPASSPSSGSTPSTPPASTPPASS